MGVEAHIGAVASFIATEGVNMVKNKSVLVMCALLPAACERPAPEEPPLFAEPKPPAQAMPVATVSPVTQRATEAAPEPEKTPAPPEPVQDNTENEVRVARGAWTTALTEQRERLLLTEAKRHGVDRVSVGLEATIDQAVAEATPLYELKRVAIDLGGCSECRRLLPKRIGSRVQACGPVPSQPAVLASSSCRQPSR